MSTERKWTIGELAGEFDISQRTVRFYEEKGLLSPERTAGGYRLYGKRDRARLKLILRGKRFGFSLEEISEILGLATVRSNEADQIRKALAYGQRVLKETEQRIEEMNVMREELLEVSKKLMDRLQELEKKDQG
jgi:DNA-binding transcriptional MerR regulator